MLQLIISIIGTVITSVLSFIISQIYKVIKDNHKQNQIEMMKIHLLTLIVAEPEAENEILDLFNDYQNLGGNGSTHRRVEKWKQERGIK